MARPDLAWAALAAMAVWTLAAGAFYELRRDRPVWFFVLDVVVAIGFFLTTFLTHGEEMWSKGGPSLPSLWVMGAVLAVSIGLGWWQGLLAALSITAFELLVRPNPSFNTTANIFLLILAAAAVGAMASALCRLAEARAAADRLQAALEERARLARAVHDGVLQVLALVQRRAGEHPDLAELGRLAAEQESSLRALVQYDARATRGGRSRPARPVEGEADLVAAVQEVAGGRSLSGPGKPVLLPAPVVSEVAAAVAECLTTCAATSARTPRLGAGGGPRRRGGGDGA